MEWWGQRSQELAGHLSLFLSPACPCARLVCASSSCGSFGKVRQLTKWLMAPGTSIPANKVEGDLSSRTYLALEVTFSMSEKSHNLRKGN